MMAFTYTSRTVEVRGQQLYIVEAQPFQDKPTIVFLHDSLGCVRLWRDFPEKLAMAVQCNVLLYDRWGYGQSAPMDSYRRPVNYMETEAVILAEMLEITGHTNVILFGHSDGGTIALLTASLYPGLVKALVCEAGHIFVESVTLKGVRAAVKAYESTDLPTRLAKYHGDKTDTVFKAWTATWLRPDYHSWNIEALLPAISCPLLFIQGEQDEYGSVAQVDRTITQVSGPAEKFMIPGIGHTPHKEVSGMVLEKTTAFINGLL